MAGKARLVSSYGWSRERNVVHTALLHRDRPVTFHDGADD